MIVCSRISRYVADNIRARQKEWNAATQDRISALSAALRNVKGLKCFALTEILIDRISGLRQREIATSENVRWIGVVYNASGKCSAYF